MRTKASDRMIYLYNTSNRPQPTSLLHPAYRETWAVVMMLADFVLFANIVLKIFGL